MNGEEKSFITFFSGKKEFGFHPLPAVHESTMRD